MTLRRTPLMLQVGPELISSGLFPDKHSTLAPLWEVAANVQFYAGQVRRKLPPALMFETEARFVRGLHQQQTSDGIRWVWVGLDSGKIYRWYGPAAELIDTAWAVNTDETSVARATFFDFTAWGNWTILNNGVQSKIYKAGGAGLVGFAEGPTTAPVKFMKKFNFLLAIGTGVNRKQVEWSDADAIEVWGAETDNLAGALPIEELDTGIVAAERLGQHIALYAEDQLALLTYVGAPFVFGQRVVLDGIGAVGKMAVCSDGRMNYGVSRNGVWRTDGQSYQYLDEGVLHDYLQDNVLWSQSSKIVANRNDVTGCFDFYFPMVDTGYNHLMEGWSFDPRTGAWSKVQVFQLATERKLFSRPLLGTTQGQVMLAENDPATDSILDLQTKPMLMQARSADGLVDWHGGCLVDEISFLMKEASNVDFCVGVSEGDDVWTYTDWIALEEDRRTYKLPYLPSGTWHKVLFRSGDGVWTFNLQGFLLYGVPEGTSRETL